MGFRSFVPLVAACPGCGRTTSTTFQELARDIQDFIRDVDAGVEAPLSGRGDAHRRGDGLHRQRARRIRSTPISASRCPGTGEAPAAPVFIDGKKAVTLRGPGAAAEFKQMVLDYIERRFGQGAIGRERGGVGNAHAFGLQSWRWWSRCSAALAQDEDDDRGAGFLDRLLGARLRRRASRQASRPERRGDHAVDHRARRGERRRAGGLIAPRSPRSCATSLTPTSIPKAPAASHQGENAVLLHRWILLGQVLARARRQEREARHQRRRRASGAGAGRRPQQLRRAVAREPRAFAVSAESRSGEDLRQISTPIVSAGERRAALTSRSPRY